MDADGAGCFDEDEEEEEEEVEEVEEDFFEASSVFALLC